MTAPRLSRRLILKAPTRQPDGAGGFTRGWTALGALWAEVAPGTPRVTAQPGLAEARLPLRITLRGAPVGAPSRPVAGQRFRDGARIYAIDSVNESDLGGRFLLCLSHEEAAL
ncbi:head-tail adaptor protein [Rubellimicrobium arenae]|uniref:head-tail adaptor protein n=1 Tax=Rubellimicrobium arenae TaxID=2817372 RepID=UPI001B311097|nr:head-tail adaptor protein [Rubellimicrobium arenae]